MLGSKHITAVCVAAVALSLAIVVLFGVFAGSGLITGNSTIGYEERLFDTGRVHTLDIVMEDFDAFLSTATSEEYSPCTVVIDGEKYGNVGIRGKGNTSLSSVASMDSTRYSFKVEFDQYQTGKSYYGLDKLSLNNIISDNTYMKDYLSYTMMRDMGVAAPLCSFVYITVNGEDFGLYLAVEGVEDSFLSRNYGRTDGELYKPDSMDMGGGRGFGRDFDMEDFFSAGTEDESAQAPAAPGETDGAAPSFPDGEATPPAGFDGTPPEMPDGAQTSQRPDGEPPAGKGEGQTFEPPSGFDGEDVGDIELPGDFDPSQIGGGFGGMGSDDVKLIYTDDDPDSYPNIFDNAKTEVTQEDQARLIASLKALSEDDLSAVDTDAVIRYLVVHDFVCNGDSYTGSMVHNYYLYESDGVLSMIPWDYNLAFGAFGSMGGEDGATSAVNSPIDTPVSDGDRPMVTWIFESEEYTALYHEYYAQFMEEYFDSGYFASLIEETAALISPYVEKDPTAFCTYGEFLLGVDTLKEFCELRAQSVSGQLSGAIPSTKEGQSADSSAHIDASAISISDMGTQSMGGGGDRKTK